MGLRLHRPIRGLTDGALRTASRTYGPRIFPVTTRLIRNKVGCGFFRLQRDGSGIKFSKPEHEWVSRVGWQGYLDMDILDMDIKVATRYKISYKI